VLIRVAVEDPGSVQDLVEIVRHEVAAEVVSFDPDRRELRIECQKTPDRSLVRVLGVVEEWLWASHHPPTTVDIDGHSYVLEPAGVPR
jgi:hypothetical protein